MKLEGREGQRQVREDKAWDPEAADIRDPKRGGKEIVPKQAGQKRTSSHLALPTSLRN